ncbi:uncharacterized protein LOC132601566 [Lycium barbarum]|uniref:uncharacterized protein LOC132601566 n=1 Tax=Lycium barbarum TaxID=112863 RepID=UPI00293E4325|nr:uncharacterized protein LOC132601566 [Lycium barbarum]
MATANKTRPSCARVKVEVDLLGEFPKRINIRIKKKRHNEQDCYVIHPELYPKDKEQSSDKEQEENSKVDQRKNKDQKNAKNSRSEIKEYKGTNANIMKGKEIADKVRPAEGIDNDGFKEKKGKQGITGTFIENTYEDIIDVTDVHKSSDLEAKMSDALNQIVTVQQIVDNNEKVKEKQMEESKEKQIDESNKVERISVKAWIEKNFGKQLNHKGEILSQQVSKVISGTFSQKKEHDSEETGDILIHKNLEEENKLGDVLQEHDDHDDTPISKEEVEDNQGKEGTRPPESNSSVILPVEQVENAHHEEQDEIRSQADLNSQDEEDLTQNIDDIAQEADLFPRSVQKLKQATNKQKPVRSTSIPVAGVSTRRSKNKTNNSQ